MIRGTLRTPKKVEVYGRRSSDGSGTFKLLTAYGVDVASGSAQCRSPASLSKRSLDKGSGFQAAARRARLRAGASWAPLSAAALARNKFPNRLIIGNHGEPRACGHGRSRKKPLHSSQSSRRVVARDSSHIPWRVRDSLRDNYGDNRVRITHDVVILRFPVAVRWPSGRRRRFAPMRRVVVKPPVFMCDRRDTSIEAVGVGPS